MTEPFDTFGAWRKRYDPPQPRHEWHWLVGAAAASLATWALFEWM
ncbi:MAG: hypothetical protein O3C40_31770 [Planctomycetota bacterium]|nr:hypothetical protein [Planctomycetota bacterium]